MAENKALADRRIDTFMSDPSRPIFANKLACGTNDTLSVHRDAATTSIASFDKAFDKHITEDSRSNGHCKENYSGDKNGL